MSSTSSDIFKYSFVNITNPRSIHRIIFLKTYSMSTVMICKVEHIDEKEYEDFCSFKTDRQNDLVLH